MKMRTFSAETMNEALALVKEELGPEAVILKTKKQPSLFGGKFMIQVTAALDEDLYAKPRPEASPDGSRDQTASRERSPTYHPRDLRARASALGGYNNNTAEPEPLDVTTRLESAAAVKRPQSTPDTAGSEPAVPLDATPDATFTPLDGLREDFQVLMKKISHIEATVGQLDHEHLLPEFNALYEQLLDRDFGSILSREILLALSHVVARERRSQPEVVLRLLRKILSNRLPSPSPYPVRPGRNHLAVLLGQTGVGKTSTIAKLCGVYQYEQGRSVGVISMDTHSINGLDRLQYVCETMEAPLRPVYSVEELEEAVRAFAHKDLILVDTSSRCLVPGESRELLEQWVESHRPDSVSLVLGCTTRVGDQWSCYQNFKDMGVDNLIYTKLDETEATGCLFQMSVRTGLPVSYLSNGTSIPDNLVIPDPATMLTLLLRGIELEPEAQSVS